ncbi:MAG: hypothetical protein AB7D05_00930 [Mangrovibacterium sp.]
MNDKIKELTENIYNEGVTRAREEAERILAEAEKKAGKIVADSQEQAKVILAEAKQESEQINSSLKAELQSISEQVIEITRQELNNVVSARASAELAKKLTADEGFLEELMLEIARGLHADKENGSKLDLLVPESAAPKVESLLKAKASEVLAAGVKIKPVAGLKEGFSIVNNGEGFKVSFTDEDFQTFFMALMKPKIREFLYSREEA